MINTISILVIVLLSTKVLLQLFLSYRHIRYIHTHRHRVPDVFSETISLDAHKKAAAYTIAKTQMGVIEALIGSVLFLLWTFAGGLNWLADLWQQTGWEPRYSGTGLILSFIIIGTLLDLPARLYGTFVIESRFGFNQMSFKLFVSDFCKALVMTVILGGPLIFAVVWLMEQSGARWWLYTWLLWLGFSLLMLWAYPKFIAPLFNRFWPLESLELKQRITALLKRCGFSANGLFVMDGSKRSSHGNAYFTGFGTNKRIVFFDTLINNLTIDETEAVLAHELGHFKHHHIKKRMALMAGMSLAGLAILGQLIDNPGFYSGLGVHTASGAMGLLLFMLIIDLVSFFVSPIFSSLSRQHEFEADEYARQQTNAQHLISALVKLYEDNASTLTPDPLHSAFYDSHPPAPLRIARLQTQT